MNRPMVRNLRSGCGASLQSVLATTHKHHGSEKQPAAGKCPLTGSGKSKSRQNGGGRG